MSELSHYCKFIFDLSPDAIFVADAKTGKIEIANPAASKLLEKPLDEIIGMHHKDLHPEEQLEYARETFAKSVESGNDEESKVEMDVICANNKRKRVEITGKTENLVGRVVTIGIFRDISDRIAKDFELKEQTRRLDLVEKIAHIGYYEIDVKTGETNWSDETFRIFDLNPLIDEEPTVEEHSKNIHPEDVAKVFETFNNSLNNNKKFNLQYRILSKNKQIKYVESISEPICDENGNVIKRFGTIQDITSEKLNELELIRTQKKLQNIYDKTPVMMHSVDAEMNILDVSKYWLKKMNYNLEDVLGRKSTEFLTEKSLKSARKFYIPSFIRDGKIDNAEYQFVTRDGELIDVLLSAESDLDNDGKVIKSYAVLNDITVRKKIEEKLKQTSKKMRDLSIHVEKVREDERAKMALNLHDDLGQKLTALNMELAWLKVRLSYKDSPLMQKVNSMQQLLNDTILSMQKISTDLRPRMLDDLGLIPTIEWLVDEFQEYAKVRCKFINKMPQLNLPDPYNITIFRVLQESLTNITRHSGATQVKIEFYIKDKFLHINLIDNGKGITKSEIEDPKSFGIFGMKERLGNISGKVKIVGEKDKGTEVIIAIPLKDSFFND